MQTFQIKTGVTLGLIIAVVAFWPRASRIVYISLKADGFYLNSLWGNEQHSVDIGHMKAFGLGGNALFQISSPDGTHANTLLTVRDASTGEIREQKEVPTTYPGWKQGQLKQVCYLPHSREAAFVTIALDQGKITPLLNLYSMTTKKVKTLGIPLNHIPMLDRSGNNLLFYLKDQPTLKQYDPTSGEFSNYQPGQEEEIRPFQDVGLLNIAQDGSIHSVWRHTQTPSEEWVDYFNLPGAHFMLQGLDRGEHYTNLWLMDHTRKATVLISQTGQNWRTFVLPFSTRSMPVWGKGVDLIIYGEEDLKRYDGGQKSFLSLYPLGADHLAVIAILHQY